MRIAAPRTHTLVTLALGVTVAGAAVLRFWALGHQGFWYDEATTAWLVRGTPAQVLATVPRTESTPPLYYLLAWAWARLFGDSEVGLRSLSAVAGVITVPVVFAAGRALANRRVGLAAAVLVAVNPLLVWYSQEARVYSLFVLVAALSLWLFARARELPTPPRLTAWAVVSGVALCTHYFAAFVVAPEALWLLADRRARMRVRLAAVAIVSAAAAAQLGLIRAQQGHASWLATVPLSVRAGEIPQQLLVGFGPPAGAWALVAAGSAVAVAAALLATRVRGRSLRAAGVAATVAAAAVLVPLVLALAGIDYVDTRNVLPALVPLAIVLAAGFTARRAGPFGIAALAGVAAVSVALVAGVVRDPGAQRANWRAVASELSEVPGRRAILIDGSSSWARTLGFYMPRTWWAPPHGARITEIDVVRRLPSRNQCRARTWWGAACDIGPRRAPLSAPAPGFRLFESDRVAGFGIARYRSPRPLRVYRSQPIELPSRPGQRRKLLLTMTRSPTEP